jgi:cobalamin biosynthesis protein CbiG
MLFTKHSQCFFSHYNHLLSGRCNIVYENGLRRSEFYLIAITMSIEMREKKRLLYSSENKNIKICEVIAFHPGRVLCPEIN